MPLSVIRGGRPQTAAWQPTDRMLATALTLYEQSLCPGCGQPREDCWNDANAWEMHTTTCGSCAVLERDREETKSPAPGRKAWTVPATVNLAGELLPAFD